MPKPPVIDWALGRKLWHETSLSAREIADVLCCAPSSVRTTAQIQGWARRKQGARKPQHHAGNCERTGIDWTEVAQDELFPGCDWHDLTWEQQGRVLAHARQLCGIPERHPHEAYVTARRRGAAA